MSTVNFKNMHGLYFKKYKELFKKIIFSKKDLFIII